MGLELQKDRDFQENQNQKEANLYPAQVFRRVLAFVIDLNLYTALSFLPSASILKKAKQYALWPQGEALSAEYFGLYVAYNVFTVLLLLSISLALFKKTTGQYFCKLELSPKPQFLEAFLYFLVLGLQLLIFGVSLLGLLVKPGQVSLHEKVSGLTLRQKRPHTSSELPAPHLTFWVRSIQSIFVLLSIVIVSLALTQKHIALSRQEKYFSLADRSSLSQTCQEKLAQLSGHHPLDGALALHLAGQGECVNLQLALGFESELPQDRAWSLFVAAFLNRFDKSMRTQYFDSLCGESDPVTKVHSFSKPNHFSVRKSQEVQSLESYLCGVLSALIFTSEGTSTYPKALSSNSKPAVHLYEKVYRLILAEKALVSHRELPLSLIRGQKMSEKGRAPAQVKDSSESVASVAQVEKVSHLHKDFIDLVQQLGLPPLFDGFVKDTLIRVFNHAMLDPAL
jgi:hypothetical protein